MDKNFPIKGALPPTNKYSKFSNAAKSLLPLIRHPIILSISSLLSSLFTALAASRTTNPIPMAALFESIILISASWKNFLAWFAELIVLESLELR